VYTVQERKKSQRQRVLLIGSYLIPLYIGEDFLYYSERRAKTGGWGERFSALLE
jgi:hypothetical protein